MSASISRLTGIFRVDPPGIFETVARPDPRIVIHFGRPADIGCERGGLAHRGVAIHGDVDIIPAGMASQWTLRTQDSALVIGVPQQLLREAATELGIDPSDAMLLNEFNARDARLEHLAWTLKTEMDEGFPSGRLFTDSIAAAMACQLVRGHSSASRVRSKPQRTGAMAAFRLRRVIRFIDENLNSDLSLNSIAHASGLSVVHCQRAFGGAMGVSVHQYVIRRRVERAKEMLFNPRFSLSQVALAVGFAHQSHMALHMRRLLGVSPAQIRKEVDSRVEPNLS